MILNFYCKSIGHSALMRLLEPAGASAHRRWREGDSRCTVRL
jgi:hypothetical protein